MLDAHALSCLADEARAVIGRGFGQLAIDLREVETVDRSTAGTLAAIGRFARRNGARPRN